MKKYILIVIAIVSMISFAETKKNTKAILENYRKEALLREARKEKEMKEETKKESDTKLDSDSQAQDITVTNEEEISEEVQNEKLTTQVDEATIDFVNYYLKHNPEKREKLYQHYKNVVGQD